MRDNSTATFLLFILTFFFIACKPSNTTEQKTCEDNFPVIEKYKLIIAEEDISSFGPFPKSGYVNTNGDTIINIDEYRCLSDTFEYFGLVQDIKGDGKYFGIDKQRNILFEAVPNGEGYAIEESEGRKMIQKNGKYGFANHKGEIIIESIFSCAETLRDGKARVSKNCWPLNDESGRWESDNWIYIDKCGNELAPQK